jgi:hypothetical protein
MRSIRTICGWLALTAAGCSGGVLLEGDGAVRDAAEGEARDATSAEDGTGVDAVDDAGPVDCEPQEAGPDGACDGELPWWKWDGARCVHLGTGCSCVGPDCGALYDSIEECAGARRACYDFDCEPQAVATSACRECIIDPGRPGVFWDGRSCFELIGCGCEGPDCDRGFSSLDECAAVHAACDGATCAATGGIWVPAAAGACGFRCGRFEPFACESPFASCRCPPGETLVSGEGCRPDAGCGPEDLCRATNGTWHPESECPTCPFYCGSPRGDCYDACTAMCDCGPHRNWVEGRGCVRDEACGPVDREAVCRATGGTWRAEVPGWSCGDYECGIPQVMEPCTEPACDCGRLSRFDREVGCVLDAACFFRTESWPCLGHGDPGTHCREGLVCCMMSGWEPGAGSCRTPCCEGAAGCMDDGCPPMPP